MRKANTKESVAVIGGSAAGLFTAYLLALAGKDVTVYERMPELNPARRTLIVTGEMRDFLGELGDGAVVNRIRRFELCTNEHGATIPLFRPDLVIERSRLIRELAKEAEAAGAKIVTGQRFVGMRPSPRGVEIRFEPTFGGRPEERAAVDAVVGADGVSSAVARACGLPRHETVSLVQATVELPPDRPPDTVCVWFRPHETPYFYWLIPDSSRFGALGLIGKEPAGAKRHLDGFLRELHLEPMEYQAARVPAFRRWVPIHVRVGRGQVYLVGDAAAQVKVSTVGGVVTGFQGAVAVADAIIGAGTSSNRRMLRRDLQVHLLVRRALDRFDETDYVRLLSLLDGRAALLLSRFSRDEATKIIWHVALQRPGIAAMMMGRLLGGRAPRDT